MKLKKILYISAMGLGDNILSIPFLLKLKKESCHITLLRYDPKYFGTHFFYTSDDILNLYRENNLIDDILFIPHNKLQLLFFILKNLWRFNHVYIPTKTTSSVLWARLLGKKHTTCFKNINDNDYYNGLVQGLLKNNTVKSLFDFKKFLKISKGKSYNKKYGIHEKFITIFPSIFERSIDVVEWDKIISFLEEKGLHVVLIGGKREEWLFDDLKPYKHNRIINLLGKTSLAETMNILSDSQVNISANGGIMWLGHLMNKYNISFHFVSGYITEPPVDNIHSFNIRKYSYPCGKPCEATGYRFFGKKGIPCCTFVGTSREGECRKSVLGEDIIYYLKKVI